MSTYNVDLILFVHVSFKQKHTKLCISKFKQCKHKQAFTPIALIYEYSRIISSCRFKTHFFGGGGGKIF